MRHEIPVVGKQDQSLAVLVQPSGGDQPHVFRLRDQIHCLAHGVAVFQRADITPRFVQHDIQFFRSRRDRLPVECHPVARSDPHGSAVRRGSVDQDPAADDQCFRSPTGTDARSAQIFCQADPVRFHVFRRGQFFLVPVPVSAVLSVFFAGTRVLSGGVSGTRMVSFIWDCSGNL